MPLDVPPPRTSRFGSPLVLSRVHWVRPELVAEVTYLEWTDDGLLRHVVYQGLRDDKPADEVRRDRPQARWGMGGGVGIGVGGALLGLGMVAAMFVAASFTLFLILLLLKPTRSELRQLNTDEIAARASYRSSALVWSIALGIGLLPALYICNAPYIQKELTRLYNFPSNGRILWTTYSVAAGELLIGVLVWRVILAVTLFIRRRRRV
jgi:hypothetical protein